VWSDTRNGRRKRVIADLPCVRVRPSAPILQFAIEAFEIPLRLAISEAAWPRQQPCEPVIQSFQFENSGSSDCDFDDPFSSFHQLYHMA
jgi:hypothetical protein